MMGNLMPESAIDSAAASFVRGELTDEQAEDLRISVTSYRWRELLREKAARSAVTIAPGTRLGSLPPGCAITGFDYALVGARAVVVVQTDVGVFVAEVGKSRLTKLEPLDG